MIWLAVTGVFIGIFFYLVSLFTRRTEHTRPDSTSAGMVGRDVEHIRTGQVPKTMPAHTRSKKERNPD